MAQMHQMFPKMHCYIIDLIILDENQPCSNPNLTRSEVDPIRDLIVYTTLRESKLTRIKLNLTKTQKVDKRLSFSRPNLNRQNGHMSTQS